MQLRDTCTATAGDAALNRSKSEKKIQTHMKVISKRHMQLLLLKKILNLPLMKAAAFDLYIFLYQLLFLLTSFRPLQDICKLKLLEDAHLHVPSPLLLYWLCCSPNTSEQTQLSNCSKSTCGWGRRVVFCQVSKLNGLTKISNKQQTFSHRGDNAAWLGAALRQLLQLYYPLHPKKQRDFSR